MIKRCFYGPALSLNYLLKGIIIMNLEPHEIITFIETSVQYIPALFVADRINNLPEELYTYEVSFTDNDIIDYDVVQKEAKENFAGTLVMLKPLELNNGIYKLDTKRDLLMNTKKNFSSIGAFMKKHG